MKKINYGIDAPQVIRNLIIFSAIGFLLPAFWPSFQIGRVVISNQGFIGMGICCGLMAIWMLLYSVYGKMRHRDRILNLINWKGTEMVLDIGTGRGLMVIGAAKRLTTGKCIGIDIWNAEDLTHNNMQNTLDNVMLEKVEDRVEIKNDNAIQLSFGDNSFDVVLSNLCLHNLYQAEDRKRACYEIGRVLKPGGIAIISDFRHIKEYKDHFHNAGLQVAFYPASYLTTFPPLPILKLIKASELKS